MTPLTLNVPIPPSANKLFANVPGKGRVKTTAYKRWRTAAGWTIRTQFPPKMSGKVRLAIQVDRQSSRADIDNRVKALIDVLVTVRVIDDDKNVEGFSIDWADIEGCKVTITPSVAP